MSPRDVWQVALGELQLQVTKATYDTWLRDTNALTIDERTLTVAVPNDYAREWLQQRLEAAVCRTVQRIVGRPMACAFVVRRPTSHKAQPAPLFDESATGGSAEPEPGRDAHNGNGTRGHQPQTARTTLNARYTFDAFVVGGGNRMAHAASLAVSETAATTYNPLFIYGGVGLGKTHLLHAIGHSAVRRGADVLCVSSERFANDLINAIRSHSTEAFRSVYRAADVLLIDDIQFIAGKESTQEEFFHTFNALHASNGRVIMTSDRAPAAIATLEERLRSRFQWGLIVDVEPPDFETRLAILRGKADSMGLVVAGPVLELIANTVQHNVRELEGALNRVMAYARCNQIAVTEDTARMALAELLFRREPPALERVIEVVAAYFGVTEEDLCGRSRLARIAEPRQVAMFLMREEADASYPQIGTRLGGRDHSTILHGCGKITRLIDRDPKLRRAVIQLKERLYAA